MNILKCHLGICLIVWLTNNLKVRISKSWDGTGRNIMNRGKNRKKWGSWKATKSGEAMSALADKVETRVLNASVKHRKIGRWIYVMEKLSRMTAKVNPTALSARHCAIYWRNKDSWHSLYPRIQTPVKTMHNHIIYHKIWHSSSMSQVLKINSKIIILWVRLEMISQRGYLWGMSWKTNFLMQR